MTSAVWSSRASPNRLVDASAFGVEQNGDGWWFCDHRSADGDTFVVFAGPDADWKHRHDFTLRRWLAAILLMAEIEAAAGDRVLSPGDAARVFARVSLLAPRLDLISTRIPF
ncbi:MAG: hypothetical protein AB7O24_07435 [Kofleriaceae bacterium]